VPRNADRSLLRLSVRVGEIAVRAHWADALNQSITHDLGTTAWTASAVRLQKCDQLLTQRVAR
jgi:hypothetical protein